MAEQDTIFSSSIKYSGLFSFASFYKFCYDWLSEEAGLDMSEGKYVEKISGDSKSKEIINLLSNMLDKFCICHKICTYSKEKYGTFYKIYLN